MAFLQLYVQVHQDSVELRGIYELKSSEPKSFPLTELLTHVNLSIAENNRLEIANEALSVIESDVARLLQPVPRRHNRDRSGNNSGSQFALDDGIARIVAYGTGPESAHANADGLRRSPRTKNKDSGHF